TRQLSRCASSAGRRGLRNYLGSASHPLLLSSDGSARRTWLPQDDIEAPARNWLVLGRAKPLAGTAKRLTQTMRWGYATSNCSLPQTHPTVVWNTELAGRSWGRAQPCSELSGGYGVVASLLLRCQNHLKPPLRPNPTY